MRVVRLSVTAAIAALSLHSMALSAIADAKVERSAPDRLSLSWTSPDPVDVYVSDRPDAAASAAQPLARGARSAYSVEHADRSRRYFILVDARDHQTIRAAERLVPLAQGSNFRDVGGYPAADGKHVRWGLIYRSGAQPLLTPDDVAQLHAIGLAQLVDLRSKEERSLAPTAIDGVPYTAIGYSMAEMFGQGGAGAMRNGTELYRRFPHEFAPQLKVIFADLLHHQAPIVYNCSAGQDRTGFATAMILSALGVPRETIYSDYQLSTAYRRPEFEMPKIDPALHPNDPAAQLFARAQAQGPRKPQPLVEADGQPFLKGAFEEIDAKWGSVDAYLRQEIGLTDADIAALRRDYLE
jgi:protein-tyrosine phosphatase